MDGFLLVNKPKGISSFGIVAKVRNILRTEISKQQLATSLIPNSQFPITPLPKVKVGHTGTLDPAAEGLMILVMGNYTKRASEFSKSDKVYAVEATLGYISSTGDVEGELSPKSKKVPNLGEVNKVLLSFQGEIMQLPPIYSAIKVGGKRAYQLAREGKEVVIGPRAVTIYSISNVEYKYPKLSFNAHTGSGTYVRSLVEDIGNQLGTGAYMSNLVRTKVGDYSLDQAVSVGNLDYSLLLSSLKK